MVRIMIVLLVLGCGFLGWTAYKQQQRLEYLRSSLAPNGLVPQTVGRIQGNAELYSVYKERGASDKLRSTGTSDAVSYITSIAADPRVSIGRVDVDKPSAQEYVKGAIDRTYRIDPNDRKATFSRANVANFLYKLEEDSRRIKVTMVDLKTAARIQDGERPQDVWQMAAAITIREKKAGP